MHRSYFLTLCEYVHKNEHVMLQNSVCKLKIHDYRTKTQEEVLLY